MSEDDDEDKPHKGEIRDLTRMEVLKIGPGVTAFQRPLVQPEALARKFPHVRTDYSGSASPHHPDVVVIFREGEQEVRFCGSSWCEGGCGLPAGVLADEGRGELKMHSSMTACGPVMQNWRVKWKGEKHVIPEEFRERLVAAYWY